MNCIWCDDDGKNATLKDVHLLIVEAITDGSEDVLAETLHMIAKPIKAILQSVKLPEKG